MLLSAAFFFFVLASNLVLRALRGQIGVSAGTDNLPLLFTATFVTMMVANGVYWTLVNRLPKRKFVPFTYHVIAASLLLLYVLLRSSPEASQDGIKFTFFVWYSVINLFTVCLFWVCMVDFFTHEQGKRLFAFIGVGGLWGGLAVHCSRRMRCTSSATTVCCCFPWAFWKSRCSAVPDSGSSADRTRRELREEIDAMRPRPGRRGRVKSRVAESSPD